jgi:hypothetical protein
MRQTFVSGLLSFLDISKADMGIRDSLPLADTQSFCGRRKGCEFLKA